MKEIHSLAASIRQKLKNLARERGEDFQQMLVNYALESGRFFGYNVSCRHNGL